MLARKPLSFLLKNALSIGPIDPVFRQPPCKYPGAERHYLFRQTMAVFFVEARLPDLYAGQLFADPSN